jgi:sialic acid synthase SpsE
MSLEPAEMRAFVRAIRDLEIALGNPRRVMHTDEIKKRRNVRRSIYLKAAVKAGTRLADAAVDFRRPGFGIGPDMYDTLADRRFKSDLPAGHLLALADFS